MRCGSTGSLKRTHYYSAAAHVPCGPAAGPTIPPSPGATAANLGGRHMSRHPLHVLRVCERHVGCGLASTVCTMQQPTALYTACIPSRVNKTLLHHAHHVLLLRDPDRVHNDRFVNTRKKHDLQSAATDA